MRRSGILSAFGVCVFAVSAAAADVRVTTVPETPSPGEIFEIRLSGVESRGRVEARVAARGFPLWSVGGGEWEGVAALDRDEPGQSLELRFVDVQQGGEVALGSRELRFGSREYGVQSIKVDESMVTLSPRNQERVDRENRAILDVLAGRSAERLWSAPFRLPVSGDITGPFGVRRQYNGKPKGYHNGVDISAPRGVKVEAAARGRVALAGDYYMTGRTVVLDHGLGLHTAYFHMDATTVTPGEVVEAGAPIGVVGSTGRSTGPHLHWGVYVSGTRGDPESLLRVTADMAERDARSQVAGRPETSPKPQ